jgi:lipopolysaccharide/colanic/teichoic acid biosynthesis glycosyltransferase
MRIFDIIISLVALIILAPLFVFLVPLLKITGEGQVFYCQLRRGRYGESFRIFKFATMLKDSPNLGSGSITSKNDNRILPLGKYLRKSKINELPQLINILIGDMALIGPRPHVERDLLGVEEKQLKFIQKVRPGLSGVSSIIFRDEELLLQQYEDPRLIYDTKIAPCKALLESWYVKNKRASLDIFLLICTIHAILVKNSTLIFKFYPYLTFALDLIEEISIRNAGQKNKN